MCACALQALNLMRCERIDTLSLRPFRYYVDQIQNRQIYEHIRTTHEKWFESIFYAVTFWAQFGVRFSFVSVRFGSAECFFFHLPAFFLAVLLSLYVYVCVVFVQILFSVSLDCESMRFISVSTDAHSLTHSLLLALADILVFFYFGGHSCFRTCMCCSLFYIWCCCHFISTD